MPTSADRYRVLPHAAAVVLGLGLYIAFIAGVHAWLIGVPVSAPWQ